MCWALLSSFVPFPSGVDFGGSARFSGWGVAGIMGDADSSVEGGPGSLQQEAIVLCEPCTWEPSDLVQILVLPSLCSLESLANLSLRGYQTSADSKIKGRQ